MASPAHSLRRTRRCLILFAAITLPLAVCAAPSAAAPSAGRVVVPGGALDWTAHAQRVASRVTGPITFQVVLPLRNAAQAAKVAAAVSDPNGASYGNYLSPAQFNSRFGPTAAQVAQVSSYLRGQGVAVTGVAAGNRWVSASGTAASVQRAFATSVATYRYRGRTLRGSSALSVPAAVAPLIAGVIGVSQSASLRKPAAAPPPPAHCSSFWDQYEQVAPLAYGRTSFPTIGCGNSATQVRSAYGVQPLVSKGDTGNGVTVAIIDAYASPTVVDDTNQLASFEGEPTLAAGQYTETDFGPFDLQDECNPTGWNVEETLDVQAVHAMAPAANIHYFGAMDCDTGIDAAANFVVQNRSATIVSNSYGFAGEDGLGSEVALEDSIYLQAATEGIGFYFSTGDAGDNVAQGAPHPEPDFPSTDTWVTAVGGTSLALTSSNGYLFETSWGDDLSSVNFATTPASYVTPPPGNFVFGGGGGVSALFTEPIWQRLDVPKSLATLNGSTPMRVVPDLAAIGDPETGFLIDFGGGLGVEGGTSLSCPVIAGIQALASQGRRQAIGFATPSLYVIALAKGVFHDVQAPASPIAMITTSGRSLLTLGQDSSLTATKGYDDSTGLGTPNGAAYVLGELLLG
jgi:subtilase family serine protease